MRSLTTDATVNESADPALLLKRYERQIRELKQELAMRDALRCGGAPAYAQCVQLQATRFECGRVGGPVAMGDDFRGQAACVTSDAWP